MSWCYTALRGVVSASLEKNNPNRGSSITQRALRCKALSLAILSASIPAAADPVSFTDVTNDPVMGISFERAPSDSYADLIAAFDASRYTPVSIEATFAMPFNARGYAGVALIDHDGDGDTDIYLTNGPGAPNGLFSNQLVETGTMSFVDVSLSSGADATDLDTNGVCFGDLDNDGDEDLYLLGRATNNRLLANNGDGTFTEVLSSGAEGGTDSHVSCSMGDIDGDGLLDIAVANNFDPSSLLALVAVPYDLNQRNLLLHNDGNLTFSDVSSTSGIWNMTLGGTTDPQPPTITWSVAMIDIDLDGDIDVVFADDQAALPAADQGGFDRGYLQVFLNDGTGHFTNQPANINANSSAAWMALNFGDLDCNGTMDMFSSNLGDYMPVAFAFPGYALGQEASRWYFGNGDGTFTDPGAPFATAFGWGNGVTDLDNDGDQDILYHGSMDVNNTVVHENPGVVYENQECTGTFTENYTAFRGDYTPRGTQGVAVGDLDQDGYVDVVTSSHHTMPDGFPFAVGPAAYGSDLDATAVFYQAFEPCGVAHFFWNGIEQLPGTPTIELNNGDGQGSVSFKLMGTKGLTSRGEVNRSGIGATVRFTPDGGQTVMSPVMGGSSFLSQNELDAHFGLGEAVMGTVDVQWPNGVRNRLHSVAAGERLLLPEIPCDIGSPKFVPYARCVAKSLTQLRATGVLSTNELIRLGTSAMYAFYE